MKKIIILSLNPYWAMKILNGEKTLEIRKTLPKCDYPVDVYIYVTLTGPYLIPVWADNGGLVENGTLREWIDYYEVVKKKPANALNGKVVAKFTLNKVHNIHYHKRQLFTCPSYSLQESSVGLSLEAIVGNDLEQRSCLSFDELDTYLCKKPGYAWEVEDLFIFNKAKDLNEFYEPGYMKSVEEIKNPRFPDVYKRFKPTHDAIMDRAHRLQRAPQSWYYAEF